MFCYGLGIGYTYHVQFKHSFTHTHAHKKNGISTQFEDFKILT